MEMATKNNISDRSNSFVKRMDECASMKPKERYKCQKLAINSNIPRMSLNDISNVKRKHPNIARIINKFPAKRPDQENVMERMDRRMEEKKILSGEVYQYFSKDRMTSAYQDRVLRILDKVKKNEIHNLDEARNYYNNLTPIKEQTTKRIDRPLTESEMENWRE